MKCATHRGVKLRSWMRDWLEHCIPLSIKYDVTSTYVEPEPGRTGIIANSSSSEM